MTYPSNVYGTTYPSMNYDPSINKVETEGIDINNSYYSSTGGNYIKKNLYMYIKNCFLIK